ncbi:MAG: hypothetical protein QNJ54_12010 [Prochloraceae cyanobacterium]|nr:hypothetical protein [Prochloraceae cyanobacterium]
MKEDNNLGEKQDMEAPDSIKQTKLHQSIRVLAKLNKEIISI